MDTNKYYNDFYGRGNRVVERMFNKEDFGDGYPGLQGVIHNIIANVDYRKYIILEGNTPSVVDNGDGTSTITVSSGFLIWDGNLTEVADRTITVNNTDSVLIYLDSATTIASTPATANGLAYPIICYFNSGTIIDMRIRYDLINGKYWMVDNRNKLEYGATTWYQTYHQISVSDELDFTYNSDNVAIIKDSRFNIIKRSFENTNDMDIITLDVTGPLDPGDLVQYNSSYVFGRAEDTNPNPVIGVYVGSSIISGTQQGEVMVRGIYETDVSDTGKTLYRNGYRLSTSQPSSGYTQVMGVSLQAGTPGKVFVNNSMVVIEL